MSSMGFDEMARNNGLNIIKALWVTGMCWRRCWRRLCTGGEQS